MNASKTLASVDPQFVAAAVGYLSMDHDSSGRNGGVLVIAVFDSMPDSLAARNVGLVVEGKLSKYGYHAHEKIQRLHERRKTNPKEALSSESADGVNTYGGCVAFTSADKETVYISFSGAHPLIDEAVSYALGVRLGLTPVRVLNHPLIEKAGEWLRRAVKQRK